MKGRILIVDDEESIRYTFDSFLSDDGHTVETAKNYDDAYGKITSRDYDLIFMDIILGGNTGINLLREAKKLHLRCPIVMITGYPNIETASDAVRYGAFDYIFKPIRQETLLHTTNMALQNKALIDQNEKYRLNLEAIFRSVKDAVITVDENLMLLEVNEASNTICGISKEDAGKPFTERNFNCSGKCATLLQSTITSKKPAELYRTECDHKEKTRQTVTISSSPLIDHKNRFSGAVLIVRDETRITDLEKNLRERQQFKNIIGESEGMQKIYSLIEDVADVTTTILILGESGTGKELVAEAIHYSGQRRDKPIVKVNCSALSENLLESELFGHVRGAFTGADRDKTGRFQKAEGGSIFLDEIGDISPRMQLRLLRVLQEKEFERVGDSTSIKADVRVIAATNQNLPEKVRNGTFREDLFYRLKVVEIMLPPLRERTDDILLLTSHFINKFNAKFDKNIETVSDDVKNIFLDYGWPGNIREMEHALEHAFIVSHQNIITLEHLPANLRQINHDSVGHTPSNSHLDSDAILNALRKSGWNKAKAARMLGINVRTIYRKLDQFNIPSEKF